MMNNKKDKFSNFLLSQNQSWQLSADNYRGLMKVEEKELLIDGCQIRVQFNPERMRSSNAKTDQNSIAARKCFLCTENRPPEQISFDLGDNFLLLVNPFPIFHQHFTIPSVRHTPQLLSGSLTNLFAIARQIEGYTVFYNGPECGASAPDHLHFQAGENGFMPVESEFEQMIQKPGSLLYQSDQLKIWTFDDYLRKMISIETNNPEVGVLAIANLLDRFGEIQPEKTEPMINLLCYFRNGRWILHLFPRKLHRPRQFYEEGSHRLLISPASVDFGGVFITPRREDFDKITADDIKDIFDQVSLGDEAFLKLKLSITNDESS
jgi:ATP adenylyltransferase/5',5'''-P-1,P-4-tetraphosphate phosphorylase II